MLPSSTYINYMTGWSACRGASRWKRKGERIAGGLAIRFLMMGRFVLEVGSAAARVIVALEQTEDWILQMLGESLWSLLGE
jgi:hypothetical protein